MGDRLRFASPREGDAVQDVGSAARCIGRTCIATPRWGVAMQRGEAVHQLRSDAGRPGRADRAERLAKWRTER
jgi:hypothetical protein